MLQMPYESTNPSSAPRGRYCLVPALQMTNNKPQRPGNVLTGTRPAYGAPAMRGQAGLHRATREAPRQVSALLEPLGKQRSCAIFCAVIIPKTRHLLAPAKQAAQKPHSISCALSLPQATGRRRFSLQYLKPHKRDGPLYLFKHLKWPINQYLEFPGPKVQHKYAYGNSREILLKRPVFSCAVDAQEPVWL